MRLTDNGTEEKGRPIPVHPDLDASKHEPPFAPPMRVRLELQDADPRSAVPSARRLAKALKGLLRAHGFKVTLCSELTEKQTAGAS